MKQPDWSKAPEGTTHYDPSDPDWMKYENGGWYSWRECDGWFGPYSPGILDAMDAYIKKPEQTNTGGNMQDVDWDKEFGPHIDAIGVFRGSIVGYDSDLNYMHYLHTIGGSRGYPADALFHSDFKVIAVKPVTQKSVKEQLEELFEGATNDAVSTSPMVAALIFELDELSGNKYVEDQDIDLHIELLQFYVTKQYHQDIRDIVMKVRNSL